MGNLLSSKKGKAPTVTAIDEAILDLKIARKRLVDQKKRQELLSERALATVQQLLKSEKKDRAMVALRKRKLHENQILHVEGCILRIDEQLCSVETTSQQAALVGVLKSANVAIKEMQQQMKIEDIEKLMDESADAAQYLEEVQAVLGQSLVGQDESDLAAELKAMEERVVADQLAELPSPVKNPENWKPATAKPGDAEPAIQQPQSSANADAGTNQAQVSEQANQDVLDLPDVPTTVVEPAAAKEPAKPALEEPLLA